MSDQGRLSWRCRCTEPAPDGLGTVRIRRPGDQSSCHVCGREASEYEAEIAEQQLDWMNYMERVEQEVFPDSRPRSEVIVEVEPERGGPKDRGCPDGARWGIAGDAGDVTGCLSEGSPDVS